MTAIAPEAIEAAKSIIRCHEQDGNKLEYGENADLAAHVLLSVESELAALRSEQYCGGPINETCRNFDAVGLRICRQHILKSREDLRAKVAAAVKEIGELRGYPPASAAWAILDKHGLTEKVIP